MLTKNIDKLYCSAKKLQVYRQINDWFWVETVYQNRVNTKELSYDNQKHEIYLPSFQINLSREDQKYHFLLKESNIRLAKRLTQEFQAKFDLDEHQNLIIEIDGIKAKILGEQDLEIIREIFEQGVYNFIDNSPLVVIDIGMNVGWASLYFASQNNTKAVYAYEPFKINFQEALDNFSLNPELSTKINPFDYGLGGQEETITVKFDYSVKASIGVEGIPEYFNNNQAKSLAKEDILVKDVRQVLSPIFAQYDDIDFMAKIDCEGSEYDILKSLDQANFLRKFKIIVLEWHEKGPQKLEDYLRKNGFTVFSRRPKSKTIGMIYAVRS